jgi:hypothetical protein
VLFPVQVRQHGYGHGSPHLDRRAVCAFFLPWEWLTTTTVAVLPARCVGDPALDWGGRALCAESERGPACKSILLFRSLWRLGVFPPQSRVATLGIACSTHLAETGISALLPSLKLARMRGFACGSPLSRHLTSRHIGAHPVGQFLIFSSCKLDRGQRNPW